MDRLKLEVLFRDLYKIAMEDGLISDDEQNILDSVSQNIDQFLTAYDLAMSDNMLTKEEVELLNLLYERIYYSSADTADSDKQLTTDEFSLLIRIVETIRQNL